MKVPPDMPRHDGKALHLHLDAVGGVAGDMFVAALLDAFPGLVERVLADVEAVLPPGSGVPALSAGQSGGVRALRFELASSKVRPHDHGHHHDDHPESPAGNAGDTHGDHGTSFARLRSLIAAAPLAAGTAAEAIGILTILAEAEAHIHGIDVDDVHFHEVGDWDSLMDVVAAGSIAASLHPARWTVSPLPRGGGLVKTQHGLLPVPAPATARILSGFAWRDDGIGGERVTPTGAAILRQLCETPMRALAEGAVLAAAGTGAGSRDLAGMPNVLRLTVFEETPGRRTEAVDVLTFDVDDMTGEEIAVAVDRLRTTDGVIDLTLLGLSGKKGRPVTRFEILAKNGRTREVSTVALLQTSTLGLRCRREERIVLDRVAVVRGGRKAKAALRPDGTRTVKVESDELAVLPTLAARRAAGTERDDE